MRTQHGGTADKIQSWFSARGALWTSLSFSSVGAIICVYLACNLFGSVSELIRPAAWVIAVPFLLLFVIAIFWRGSLPLFLSAAGALSSYFSFYIYLRFPELSAMPQFLTNKLGVGKVAVTPAPDSLATMFFLTAMFAFAFALVLAYRPSIFWAKGSRSSRPFPIWKNSNDRKAAFGSSVMLIPLQGLLSYAERHLAAKYLYILVIIGGKEYFVAPDEWIPQGSLVARDRNSGSFLGIPKVSDGFNVW